MPERAGGVVARDCALDLGGARLDGARDRRAGLVDADDDEQVGPGRVGHPGDLAGEAHAVAVERRARRVGAVLAAARVDGPALDEVAGRARGQPRRAHVARRHRLQRLVAGGLQQRAGRQQPEQRRAGQDAAALLRHEHGVEGAEPGAAAVLVDQQPGPAGLDHGRPQVGQRACPRAPRGPPRSSSRATARRARPRAGTPARPTVRGSSRGPAFRVERCARRAMTRCHTAAASFSFARSSLNGTPLSSRGSGGRPSTRSPIVLRRISSVPPADFSPGRNEIM